MIRFLTVIIVLLGTAGSIYAVQNPKGFESAKRTALHAVNHYTRGNTRAVEISRTHNGEFALRAKINGVPAPMVIDTGATSVVLTYETAKAAGLPLELVSYDVDVETAGGRVRAARLTLDRLAIGKLVELSVPALVVPKGRMKSNLLGMSFLNRLESWEVRPEKLVLHGYP
ncbi:MAG: TIGR02281 family clan AA aspartic protease [Rhizobiales bacterium]|nr:TIGR02281 family clan AA aspartic protease [Hyphomicrobiales bacterium]